LLSPERPVDADAPAVAEAVPTSRGTVGLAEEEQPTSRAATAVATRADSANGLRGGCSWDEVVEMLGCTHG
jgi:hypothetical protein